MPELYAISRFFVLRRPLESREAKQKSEAEELAYVWHTHPLPVLKTITSDPKYYDLMRKKVFLIGKAGSNASIKIDDYTVSNSHAEISCIKKTVDGKLKLFLQIIDKNSKFGTFVRDREEKRKDVFRQIEIECPVLLSYGGTVRFGLNQSGCFEFVSKDYFICKDDLNEIDTKTLEKTIRYYHGINFSMDLPKITHYVNSNSILKKSILGLASLTPLVTVQYFIDLCKALLPNSEIELPFTEDYVPDLMESLSSLSLEPVSLDINPVRRHLFIGKTFISYSIRQKFCIENSIIAAGGIVHYYTNCDEKMILNNSDYILVQQDPCYEKPKIKYQLMFEKYKTINKRPISQSEIELAIIFVSTRKYCNPYFNETLVDLQTQSSETQSQVSMALAPSTEEAKTVDYSQKSDTYVPDNLS